MWATGCHTPFMAGEGPQVARVAFVGDSPNGLEDKWGRPFVGDSGNLLWAVVADGAPEWKRGRNLYLTNAVRCRPYQNKTEAKHTRSCQELLVEELEGLAKLEIVVTFGNEALWSLTGKRGITAEHGIPRKCSVGSRTLVVAPCYHPAYALRDQGRLPDFVQDIDTAFEAWKEGLRVPPPLDHRLLHTAEEWERFLALARACPVLAYDIETNTLKPWDREDPKVLGVSFATAPGVAWFAPLDHPQSVLPLGREAQVERLRAVLEDPSIPKADHNGQFDTRFLRAVLGIDVRGVVMDTKIGWHLLDENDSAQGGGALNGLAARHTPLGAYKEEALEGGDRAALDVVPLLVVARYASLDADATLRLAEKFAKRLHADDIPCEVMEWELRKRRALAEFERRGACVDWDYHAELMQKFPDHMTRLNFEIDQHPAVQETLKALGEVDEEAGLFDQPTDYKPLFNHNSQKMLKHLCYETLRLEPPAGERLTKKGKAAKDAGEEVDYLGQKADALAFDYWLVDFTIPSETKDLLAKVQELRQTAKVFSTYVKPLRGLAGLDGRIHSNFNGSSMVTWRTSSSEPNLQNLPRQSDAYKGRPVGPNDVKRLYCAPQGWRLVAADYSQLELRVIAIVAQEANLLDCFNNGVDVHTRLASRLYRKPLDQVTKDERSRAKPGNFGCAYLMSADTLAREHKLPPLLAHSLHAAFWAENPSYERWTQEQRNTLLETQRSRSLFGHVRRLPGVLSQNKGIAEESIRAGTNFPIQCTASCLCSYAQAVIQELLEEWGWGAYCFLNVHDSIVVCAPEAEVDGVAVLMREVMEGMPFEWLYGTPRLPHVCPIKADIETGTNLRDLRKWVE